MNDQKPHNPNNLTPEQIGTADGWRLLAKDEVFGNSIPPIHSYGCLSRKWFDDGREHGEMWGTITYRTKLTRAELRAARGLPPETEATARDTPRTDAMPKVYRYRSAVSGLIYDNLGAGALRGGRSSNPNH